MTVQPFEINIEPAVLDDLRNRLRGTRWPDEIDSAGWDYGMNGSVLRSFVHTWAGVRLAGPADSAQPVPASPGRRRRTRRAPYAKAVDGAGLPLVVLHGWPSSFVQMLPVVPLLTTGADPFDVVVMSLPGYGFEPCAARHGPHPDRRDRRRGHGPARLPAVWRPRRDLGAGVLQQLALNHPRPTDRAAPVRHQPTSAGSPTTSVRPSSSSSPTRSSGTRPRWPTPRTLLQAADPGPRPQRLPSRARRLDLGEVPPMERLPRRPRLRLRP